jgi:hypothetical protein
MEPAKYRETAVKAARLPSGLCRKPASAKACHCTTLDQIRELGNGALVGNSAMRSPWSFGLGSRPRSRN